MRKVVVFLAFLCCSNLANALPEIDLCPYVGADATWRHMGYKAGFGNGLFKTTVPQGNIYAGVQLMDYLALEGGYEAIRRKSKTVVISPGDFGLGYQQPSGGAVEDHVYKEELKGWHLDLIGIAPCLPSCDPSLRFFGGLGVSRKKIRLKDETVNDNSGTFSQADADDLRRTLVKSKSFLRLSIGVQKLLTDCIGVRAIVNWENTARFGYLKSQEAPAGITSANLKNALSGGVGVFVKF